jgi:hypothetical protein
MVQAKTFIGPQNILEYHRISEKKSACVEYAWRDSFCSSFTLKYPYTRSIQNRDIAKILDARIEELSQDYTSHISDREGVIDELNPDSNDTGHFDWDISLDLFSFTPKTVTLSFTQSRYTGGAHAVYDDCFENYDLKSGKALTLKDLVKNEERFTQIAEEIYRATYHIPKNEDMTYDGWFNKAFGLAENFALTPRGFYFLYNSYEIKAYADGLTPLFVPYDKVRNLLSSAYFSKAFFDEADKLSATYNKKFAEDLSVSITPEGEDYLHIVLKTRNSTYHMRQGWLSVTFAGQKDVIVSNIKSDFQHVKRYPNGIDIYHKPSGKTIQKHDVLLEAYAQKWDHMENDTRQLSFTIQKPKKTKKLSLLIRLILKTDKSTHLSPDPEFYKQGVMGQQGFYNYRVELPL